MLWRLTGISRLHFVGVGGAGMSGIAEVLLEPGFNMRISGCDLAASDATERLERLGVAIQIGHSPDHVEGMDVLIVSSAIARDNPEIREARSRGIAVVRRSEMLAELMRLRYGIAVAGTHGKTTTTSLVGAVLTEAGLDPTVIVGGRLRVSGTGARLGHSDYLVVEADEFDRSFLRLQPVVAVVTSIDSDHLDTYADIEAIQDAFVDFASRAPFFGQVIVCLDDPRIQQILPRLEDRRVVTYGLSPQSDLAAVAVETLPTKSRFQVRGPDGLLGAVELPLPGHHNVRNALAAVAVGRALDIGFEQIAGALGTFAGVHRRFERVGLWRGATIVDDYAHHPTEVTATLEAARQAFPASRVHAVFQPHLYSRTRDLAREFGRALLGADTALVTAIYASREQPIAGVDARQVVRAARASGHRQVSHCPDWRDAPAALAAWVAPGDVVLTLGAGDVYRLAERLAAEGRQEGEP